ncbi:DUF2484 family protein [Actibacterium lipolyticum]|uniref:UDP-N-acetylmuramate--alanine ligase n=1 Tax=Actibacterium lipolyticum TaxID=1524263 RepID=A0A238JT35_9RHOB|nr:DUF2484 family protein [Actibacterium lipolyticum]SMX33821.1 hypothetical protein COL8621_01105 [Actibacterium lipolyticum]
MTLSLTLACFWTLAAAITAMLPMRMQYPPGLTLLILAPAVIGFLAWQHNVWVVLLAVGAFASMFRNPLIYLYRRARGLPARRPEEKENR